MSIDNPNHLNGKQAESWFKEFSQHTDIYDRRTLDVQKVTALLNKELPKRFENGVRNIDADYPDGDQWIREALYGKDRLSIPHELRQEFALYLLDQIASTDVIISLPGENGKSETIAVDVTTNATKEQNKIGKIKGLPDAKDRQGENRNQNIGRVRKSLGITKHMLVIIDADRTILPTYDKLLKELKDFAQGPNTVGIKNLQGLETQYTLGGEYQKLAAPHQNKTNQERVDAIADISIQRGDHSKYTAQLLRLDPAIQDLNNKEALEKLPLKIAQEARNKTVDAQIIKRIDTILSQAKVKRGNKEFKAGTLNFEKTGENYSILDDKRGLIFKANQFNTYLNKLTPQEQERFSGVKRQTSQQKLGDQPTQAEEHKHQFPKAAFKVIQAAIDNISRTQTEGLAQYIKTIEMSIDDVTNLYKDFGIDISLYEEGVESLEKIANKDLDALDRDLSDSEFQLVRGILDAYARENTREMASILSDTLSIDETIALFQDFNLNIEQYSENTEEIENDHDAEL